MSLVRFTRCAHCGQVLSWYYIWQNPNASYKKSHQLRATDCCSIKVDETGMWHITPLPDFTFPNKEEKKIDDGLNWSCYRHAKSGDTIVRVIPHVKNSVIDKIVLVHVRGSTEVATQLVEKLTKIYFGRPVSEFVNLPWEN